MAKNFVDEAIKSYRKNFNMNLASAILYPHESERRRDGFFCKKIINGAVDIKNGKIDTIEVGDVNGYRDVGYAKDYMEACHLIMSQDVLEDYIIGTGISTRTSSFIEKVFKKLELGPECIVVNNNLKRGDNLSHLIADNTKIRKLGWEPTKTVDDIIDIMIENKLNE
jgi:GDPmannose 4,6-dehydratase